MTKSSDAELDPPAVLAAAHRFPWAVAAPQMRHWPDGAFLNTALSAVRPEERAGYIERLETFVELFTAAVPDDVLLIWQAKTASMDADASIEVHLLCGSGLADAKGHLASDGSGPAQAALQRLIACERVGDFENFSVAQQTAFYSSYYA
ncbi:hypothetical protein AAGT00_01080 (plasmid) [Streptomyces cavourensis]